MNNINEAPAIIKKKKIINGEEFDISYRKLKNRPPAGTDAKASLEQGRLPNFPRDGRGDWPPLNQRTYVVEPGIICEQDVAVPMRDGVITYCDVFRPDNGEKVPALISYSFYGKRPGADTGVEWQTLGVPEHAHSINTKFEGPCPEYWCHKGYAIINNDPRGVNNSQGDIEMWSSQEGRDGYDLVEWLAKQEWCNGKVSFVGNSALAMAQWRIAQERPPHLACIAPWQGTAEIYREMICWGGFVESGFNKYLTSRFVGAGYIEDPYLTIQDYPLHNAYWEDKIPKWDQIEVPAYITGGWCHFHLRGSTNGFRNIKSKDKWIRLHREWEWWDLYSPEALEDLIRFFDRYMKGIHNGWEYTPRVRVDVTDAYDFDYQVKRGEDDWPIPRTQYKKLYLDAKGGAMQWEPALTETKVVYDAETGNATFDFAFEEDTELTGYMKLKLWVEADGHDDMDLFVAVKKLDPKGKWLPLYIMGKEHPGSPGKMRVSLRETDPEKSTEFQPWYPYTNPQKLAPGEIVPVEIEIYPNSRIFHKGEQLRVEVQGHYDKRIGWFEPWGWDTDNKGNHVIHTGGKYDAFLLIPVIPPKYVAGDTIYR